MERKLPSMMKVRAGSERPLRKKIALWLRDSRVVKDDALVANCSYCGKEQTLYQITVDHVLPTSCGGKSSLGNLVFSCGACNQTKGNQIGWNGEGIGRGMR